ncbi:MAG: four helix bundle protein, partial [Anaerolineales bacterium]|nr:four helix bundle protein [Anaerolineales bacterium]
LVRATDSIGANIAEAYGRYHYGEKLRFLYYARGSLYETRYWLRQALKRELIRREQADTIAQLIHPLALGINNFAASIRQQKNRSSDTEIREEPITYATSRISQSLNLPISDTAIIFSDEDLSCLQKNAS